MRGESFIDDLEFCHQCRSIYTNDILDGRRTKILTTFCRRNSKLRGVTFRISH